MRTSALLSVLALGIAACSTPTPLGYRARMDADFLGEAPREGERLPDAQGFDAEGRPFALADTRGQVTVLVTGCLT